MPWFAKKAITPKDIHPATAAASKSTDAEPAVPEETGQACHSEEVSAESDRIASYIQVGYYQPGRLIFGYVTTEHLLAFQIPIEQYKPLYRGWFQLLRVTEEDKDTTSVRCDGEALYGALHVLHPEITRLTCLRWSLLMNAAMLFSILDYGERHG